MSSRTGNVKQDQQRKKVDAKVKSRTSTYGSAKKQDPKLDSYIKARNNAKKGSPEYNAAQNLINKAYNSTAARKSTTPKGPVSKVARKSAAAVSSSAASRKPSLKTPLRASAPTPAKAVKTKRRSKAVAQGADRADVRSERKQDRQKRRNSRAKAKPVKSATKPSSSSGRATAALNNKLKGLS